MKTLHIKNILIPTDFSKTGLLALEHAAFMARLFKADLFLLHAIEITETTFNIYNPVVSIGNLKEIEKIGTKQLNSLAKKIAKKYAVKVKTVCSWGKVSEEVTAAVKENDIDIVVMGTHGANGVNEFFIGSNAHKTVSICPCPVITVQTHAKKLGFTNIVLPIDNTFHSREKVDSTIGLAKKYAAKIHILGLLDENEGTDPKKLKIKLASIEKAVKNAGLPYECKIVKGHNLAATAIKYSKKMEADLIVALTNHESRINGMFLEAFSKQIVNHSKIPVMSIKPVEGNYDFISLAGASPF